MDCFKHLGYCPKCARFLIITPPLRISPEIDWYHYQVVFNQRSSSIKYCLPSKVIFYQMLSPIKGRLPSKVVFHQSLSVSTNMKHVHIAPKHVQRPTIQKLGRSGPDRLAVTLYQNLNFPNILVSLKFNYD